MLVCSPGAHAAQLNQQAINDINNGNIPGVVRTYSPLPVQGGDGPTITSYYNQLRTATSRTNPTAAPWSAALERDAVNLAQRTGSLPKPGILGAIALGATAFDLGWKIGTGINAKWLHFGVPKSEAGPDVSWNTIRFTDIKYYSAGDQGLFAPAVKPFTGFYGVPSWTGGREDFAMIPGEQGVWDQGTSCQRHPLPLNWFTASEVPLGTSGWHCTSANYGDVVTQGSGVAIYTPSLVERTGLPPGITAPSGKFFSLPVPYTNQAVTRDTGTFGISDPGTQGLINNVQQQLTQHPNDYPVLIPWLNHVAAPNATNPDGSPTYPDPTDVRLNMPNCVGEQLTGTECVNALLAAGVEQSHITLTTVGFREAEITKPARTTIDTTPAGGDGVSIEEFFIVKENPAQEDMPVLVPDFHEGGAPPDPDGSDDGARDCQDYDANLAQKVKDAIDAAIKDGSISREGADWTQIGKLVRQFYADSPNAPSWVDLNKTDHELGRDWLTHELHCGEGTGGGDWPYWKYLLAGTIAGGAIVVALEVTDKPTLTGPDRVITTSPAPGTRLHPLPQPLRDELANPDTTPTRKHQIAQENPDSVLHVVKNPVTAPTVTDEGGLPDPTAGGGPPLPTSTSCGLTAPGAALDLTPITAISLADRFPFSLLTGVRSTLNGLVGDPMPPSGDISAFGQHLTDLSFLHQFDAVMVAWRIAVSFFLVFAASWYLWNRLGPTG